MTAASAALRASPARPIRRVAVVGGGTMGRGIAGWLAAHGFPVYLRTRSRDVAEGFARRLSRIRAPRGEQSPDPVAGDSYAGCASADLVIEAVTEDIALKSKVLSELAEVCRGDAILASTTSTIPIRRLAACTPNPERVVGLHFFNPVSLYPLVECIYTSRVGLRERAAVETFVRAAGKTAVAANDGDGGCVGNRILCLVLDEGTRRYLEGGDSLEVVEACLGRVFAFERTLEIPDIVGLDLVERTREYMSPARLLGYEHVRALHRGLIEAGCPGRKARLGLYDCRSRVPVESVQARALRAILAAGCPPDASPLAAERFRLLAVNEALACLAEEIADPPAIDAIMTMLGMREGPLACARRLGRERLGRKLDTLTEHHGARFLARPDLTDLLHRLEGTPGSTSGGHR